MDEAVLVRVHVYLCWGMVLAFREFWDYWWHVLTTSWWHRACMHVSTVGMHWFVCVCMSFFVRLYSFALRTHIYSYMHASRVHVKTDVRMLLTCTHIRAYVYRECCPDTSVCLWVSVHACVCMHLWCMYRSSWFLFCWDVRHGLYVHASVCM
jgi:hypothetical protein